MRLQDRWRSSPSQRIARARASFPASIGNKTGRTFVLSPCNALSRCIPKIFSVRNPAERTRRGRVLSRHYPFEDSKLDVAVIVRIARSIALDSGGSLIARKPTTCGKTTRYSRNNSVSPTERERKREHNLKQQRVRCGLLFMYIFAIHYVYSDL